MADWDAVQILLDRFERNDKMYPADSEKLVAEVFRACGHSVGQTGFVENNSGADLIIETNDSGKPTRISVEVKYNRGPAGLSSVRQLLTFRGHGLIDRAMVISRSGFTPAALSFAIDNGVGLLDLLAPNDLRNWLAKHKPQMQPDHRVHLIIRTAMKELAKHIAEYPGQLASVEWRDLERVLREVFEGIGFDTKLTRSGKDGGFDLMLSIISRGARAIYLVEVKHWSKQKPGPKHLAKFLHVTASRQATAGLLLSTSGFARTIYEGLVESSAPVRLGDDSKVVSLCKMYHRLDTALWTEAQDLEKELFADTISPPPAFIG